MNSDIIKEKFSMIWKDSVWSKIISVVVIGIFTLVKSYLDGITLLDSLIAILTFNIKLYYILIFIFIIVVIRSIVMHFDGKKKLMRKFNSKVLPTRKIKMKWKIIFDEDDNPLVDNLILFCINHPIPLKLLDNSCTIPSCSNHTLGANYDKFQNTLESEVIDRWEQIKKG